MVKLLDPLRVLFQTSLNQGRNDHRLLLLPKLILAEHIVRILFRQSSSFHYSDLQAIISNTPSDVLTYNTCTVT